MHDGDREFFQHRAEVELALAQHATCAEAVAAHSALLNLYLERLYPDDAITSSGGSIRHDAVA